MSLTVRPVIHIYRNFFIVKQAFGVFIQAIYALATRYTTYEQQYDYRTRRTSWKPSKTFGICIGGTSEFRFHLNQLNELLDLLKQKGLKPQEYEVVYHDPAEASDIVLKTKPHFKLKTDIDLDQESAKDFVLEICAEKKIPLLAMPTGSGKTIVSLTAASLLKKRVAVFVLAKYVDKWVSDLQEIYDIESSDICEISGGKSLVAATHWTKDPETLKAHPLPKTFVVSIDTFSVWVKKYEKNSQLPELEQYGCLPWEFFKSLDIGTVIFDEAHEHLHKLFRIFTYLDVEHAIVCTATMMSKNPTIAKVQNMMFPSNCVFSDIAMRQYIEVYACSYQIRNFEESGLKINYPGDNRYNHNAFEESILKKKHMASQYIGMISDLAFQRFITKSIPGKQKLIVFVSSIDMGERLVAEFKKRWPKFDTRSYFQEDPYSNIIEADIRVTTVISGSTAIDIPNLTTAIMTISIDSPVSNLQALGRLRQLKDGTTPEFYYLYCSSIQKQIDYHKNKIDLLKPKVRAQHALFLTTIQP